MTEKLSEHWQEGKTLQECNLYLMENEYSDIIFRLHHKGENKREEVVDIPALRLMCLARSPVFFAMFNGKLAPQPDDRILDVHDDYADPHAFKQMVRFMYSDDVVLTADNVLAVLYVSHKYMFSTLTQKCVQFLLEKTLTPDTAPMILDQSMLYGENELKAETLTYIIKKRAPAVLASDEFITVSKDALGEILKLRFKEPEEVTVFEACMKWAKNQCEKLKKSPSGENIREVLGKLFYMIRFPTMSASDITDTVAPQRVLTGEEGFQVLGYITSESNKPDLDNLPYHTEPRNSTARSLLVPGPFLRIGGRTWLDGVRKTATHLSCTISKPLCLKTIYIHANTYPHNQQQLTVILKQNGKCLHKQNGKRLRRSTGNRPAIIGQLAMDEHFAVDVDDVLVESGAMELGIELTVNSTTFVLGYTINYSPPETSQLSDDYVTITFPPVDKNLLLGIAYCMP